MMSCTCYVCYCTSSHCMYLHVSVEAGARFFIPPVFFLESRYRSKSKKRSLCSFMGPAWLHYYMLHTTYRIPNAEHNTFPAAACTKPEEYSARGRYGYGSSYFRYRQLWLCVCYIC
ncbi:hypothetical protein I7I50_04254 [Histoplasma capsulatum G186AR]|uniref:Uncharacterized protein n=1 Tax=Ajellomyces capsulatus TaxID=5037 RepID=A0A8H7YQI2_AJECA|nr:hypothetical protein I7I52_05162 [Histoplasma capsulatum]QSS75195.1 hypothetical protein I7I50_04254 [Histoplasma capsulatum G186AR]